MLFPFENISNDRNQERKLNNNPNWLERCNSIELSFSTSFSLAKSLSKLLKIRSVYRNYETSLSRTIYHLVQMIVIITSIVSFQSEQQSDPSTSIPCVHLSIFPQLFVFVSLSLLFLSFFFLNFHTDIVIRHCYTSSKWKTIIYSTCCGTKWNSTKFNSNKILQMEFNFRSN